MDSRSRLKSLIKEVPELLQKMPPDLVSRKPAADKWSPKEELGHLIDSAANNHQRIVRLQAESDLSLPGYDQNHWVATHCYKQRHWPELIYLWRAFNQQLLVAAESVPEKAWAHTCTIADSEPLTLQFVFDDYIRHLLHHLEHIGVDLKTLEDV